MDTLVFLSHDYSYEKSTWKNWPPFSPSNFITVDLDSSDALLLVSNTDHGLVQFIWSISPQKKQLKTIRVEDTTTLQQQQHRQQQTGIKRSFTRCLVGLALRYTISSNVTKFAPKFNKFNWISRILINQGTEALISNLIRIQLALICLLLDLN